MTPESAVLKAVCDLLAAERIPFWRMNTGAVKTEKRFFRFGEKGMADVLAAPFALRYSDDDRERMPVFLWIECKSEKGQQSQFQKDFEWFVRNHRMSYLLVRTPEDLLQWLRDNGVTR